LALEDQDQLVEVVALGHVHDFVEDMSPAVVVAAAVAEENNPVSED